MSLDAAILESLRSRRDGVSGAELARSLRVTRAAVWARIEELRVLGYDIQASPHAGYRLFREPDVLHADDLRARLAGVRVIGRDIRVFRETTSTSDVVEKLARDEVAEGVVVFAESQTRGRGRLGRRWSSAPGLGLWFSVLLRPAVRPQAVTRLTIVAAVAVARAIRARSGVPVDIKWPNDLLVSGRKLAGILTEMRGELDLVRHVALGVGINVNQEERDFPDELRSVATSLRMESGEPVNRASLAVAILKELDVDYARLRNGQFERVADEWVSRCTTLGRDVEVRIGDRRLRGRAEALDEDGALMLRTEHGLLERVTGGDVAVRG